MYSNSKKNLSRPCNTLYKSKKSSAYTKRSSDFFFFFFFFFCFSKWINSKSSHTVENVNFAWEDDNFSKCSSVTLLKLPHGVYICWIRTCLKACQTATNK